MIGRRPRALAALLGLLALAGRAAGADAPVQVQLASESRAYVPGTSCWLALHFQVAEGWHLYWANPGDNGMAPTVQWLLPEGFRVTALHWPVPRRFGAAPSVSYGMDHEPVLLARLESPATAPAGGSVHLGARIKWLAGAENYVPGQADVELDLAAGQTLAPDSAVTDLFARARAAGPQPTPVSARAFGEDHWLTLFVDLPAGQAPPLGAHFFCADPEVVDHSAPQNWIADARGSRLLIPVSPHGRTPATRLRGVLCVEYPLAVNWSLDLPVQKQTLRGDPK